MPIKPITVLEPIKRGSMNAINHKNEMVENDRTRAAVIELQQKVNELISRVNDSESCKVPPPADVPGQMTIVELLGKTETGPAPAAEKTTNTKKGTGKP